MPISPTSWRRSSLREKSRSTAPLCSADDPPVQDILPRVELRAVTYGCRRRPGLGPRRATRSDRISSRDLGGEASARLRSRYRSAQRGELPRRGGVRSSTWASPSTSTDGLQSFTDGRRSRQPFRERWRPGYRRLRPPPDGDRGHSRHRRRRAGARRTLAFSSPIATRGPTLCGYDFCRAFPSRRTAVTEATRPAMSRFLASAAGRSPAADRRQGLGARLRGWRSQGRDGTTDCGSREGYLFLTLAQQRGSAGGNAEERHHRAHIARSSARKPERKHGTQEHETRRRDSNEADTAPKTTGHETRERSRTLQMNSVSPFSSFVLSVLCVSGFFRLVVTSIWRHR